jgi:hypothetical protein
LPAAQPLRVGLAFGPASSWPDDLANSFDVLERRQGARAPLPLALNRTLAREHEMSQLNVGNIAIRILLGIALVSLAAFGMIGAWGYLGVVLILTGAVALCPLYTLLGWRTTLR